MEEALTPVAFPTETEKLGSVETRLVEEPERSEGPEAHQESPTPVFLEPSVVRAARDPRVHDPDPGTPDPTSNARPVRAP
ncbi:hypothetical protein ACRAWF_34415 [Streptomyces sp. L7]